MSIAAILAKNSKKTMSSKNEKEHPPPEKELLEWRPPALTNTPLSHAHTASPRPLARTTTRTRNETETDFPIGGLLRRSLPLDLRSMKQNVCCGSRHIFYRNRLLMDGRWLPVNSRPMIS